MTVAINAMAKVTIDAAQLPAMLIQLRLPTIARLWPAITEAADRESWPAARTLAALLEHEIAERAQRRTARHLQDARLPIGKTVEALTSPPFPRSARRASWRWPKATPG